MIAANCQLPISNWGTPPNPCCIFHGALDDDASVNALTWFCHRVWPELTLRLPQATFIIAGEGSRRRVQALGEIPGVILPSSVSESSTYFSVATIAVFPYRYACTAQEDVLHALAMRKAVIATPVALDGLDLQSGVHVRTANTTSDWIAVTFHLMLHPEACAKLGKTGGDWGEQKRRCVLQRQQPAAARSPDELVPHPAHSTPCTASFHRSPVPASVAANEFRSEGIYILGRRSRLTIEPFSRFGRPWNCLMGGWLRNVSTAAYSWG